MEEKELILIAEDDAALSEIIKLHLEQSYNVVCLKTGEDIFRQIESIKPGLMLLDYKLPDITADKLISKLIESSRVVPFIIMTGYMDVNLAVDMMKLGARDYILKNSTFFNFLPAVVNRVVKELRISRRLAEAELALRENEEKYRRIVEKSTILISHFFPGNGKISFVNDAFCKFFKKSNADLIGQSFWEVYPEISKNDLDLLHSDTPIFSREYNIITPSGELWQRWIIQALFNNGGEVIEYQAIGEDITEWKKSEIEKQNIQVQLMQVQKMEAIGTLAGGVAHDFNNLLTAIIGATNLSMQVIEENHPIYVNLQQIHHASIRAAGLTRQLLLFSRKQQIATVPLNLNNTLQNLIKMLSRLIGEDISIELKLAPDLHIIHADEGNMEQIIMNLSINSRDAMPEGGKITFITKNVEYDNETCKDLPKARPGNFVSLSVIDTGMGMDKQTIQRIFEPFFSTKDITSNTGLGLSVVFGIVEQHEGWINVRSELGKGTLIEIFFPAIEKSENINADEAAKHQSLQGHGERILLVEDHEEVRNFASSALRLYGYEVFEASNTNESKEIFECENGRFDLIFCDVVLPDKNALQLISRLQEIKPGFKVLFCSGYTDSKSQWRIIAKKGYHFLPKPYSLVDLLHGIKDTIYSKQ